MEGIAEFYKVSFEQFQRDSIITGFIDENVPEEIVRIVWDKIKLPVRATTGSVGYDFYLPWPFHLSVGNSITIPTGIRACIQPGWGLLLLPRSSLGFKYGMRFANTAPLIDSDYAYANNEGHIMAKFSVDSNMCLTEGERFMQSIFVQCGTTISDNQLGMDRIGGFGSTGVD